MSNHAKYKNGLKLLFVESISGYRLHAMEYYPYAVKTNSMVDKMVVEVCRITDPEVELEIHNLELSVGYYYDEVVIQGRQTGIYLYHVAGPEAHVEDGDWVSFFHEA
jgi:hypothetical protein